jgi:curli production assembly/transport component CsgE
MRLLLACLLLCDPAYATDEDAGQIESAHDNLHISGVIIDNTVSRIGHDFFQAFSARRMTVALMPYAGTLTVIERPSARWGSLMIILDGQNVVQTFFITPGRMDVRALAAQLADTLDESLRMRRLQRLVQTAELGGDEL